MSIDETIKMYAAAHDDVDGDELDVTSIDDEDDEDDEEEVTLTSEDDDAADDIDDDAEAADDGESVDESDEDKVSGSGDSDVLLDHDTTHAEDATLYAMPSTQVDPYTPPTRAVEATGGE